MKAERFYGDVLLTEKLDTIRAVLRDKHGREPSGQAVYEDLIMLIELGMCQKQHKDLVYLKHVSWKPRELHPVFKTKPAPDTHNTPKSSSALDAVVAKMKRKGNYLDKDKE